MKKLAEKEVKTEIWAAIPNFPHYEVSSFGRIRSYKNNKWGVSQTPKILNPGKTTTGYYSLNLYKKHVMLHRLVLMAFVGPAPKGCRCGMHLDHNPLNNRLENLKWGTNSENQLARLENGTSNRGNANGMAKLNEKQVRVIKHCQKLGMTRRQVSKCFSNIKYHTISDIFANRRWGWINI